MAKNSFRFKVSRNQKKILDALAEKYESDEEKAKRVKLILFNVGFIYDSEKEVEQFFGMPAVPLNEFKAAVGETNSSQLISRISRALKTVSVGSFDLLLPNGSILRVFEMGMHTKKIFAIFQKDGKKWVMRKPRNPTSLEEAGLQKEFWKSRLFRKEEYCGIDLNALSTIKMSGMDFSVLDDIFVKIHRQRNIKRWENITYNPQTKEITVIDFF
ncbi:MAG: hypothetical protein ABIF92_01530 [archaeon]